MKWIFLSTTVFLAGCSVSANDAFTKPNASINDYMTDKVACSTDHVQFHGGTRNCMEKKGWKYIGIMMQ